MKQRRSTGGIKNALAHLCKICYVHCLKTSTCRCMFAVLENPIYVLILQEESDNIPVPTAWVADKSTNEAIPQGRDLTYVAVVAIGDNNIIKIRFV